MVTASEINFNFKGEPMPKEAPARKAPVKKSASAQTPAVREKYTVKNLQEDIATKLKVVARPTVDKVVTETFLALSEAFLSGRMIVIKDFGKIELRHRPEREGRNPATGETITIPAKTVPKFTFAKVLKEGAK